MALDLDPIKVRLRAAQFHNLVVRTAKHRWLLDDDGVFVIRIAKLDDCLPQQADMLAWAPTDIRALLDEVERLRGVVKDFAEYGTRHDLNPTTPGGDNYAHLMAYIQRMDAAVRERARAALGDSDG